MCSCGCQPDRHGSEYCIEIIAADEAEARARIKVLPWAQYKGEIFATIPAGPRSFWKWLTG